MEPPVSLPLFFDGRHYDSKWRHLTADLTFWVRQAQRCGDPILELTCGTGRVSLHLAHVGFRVTGLDISDSMLLVARNKAAQQGAHVDWVKADIRNFQLGQTFPLIIFPFNTVAILLTSEDLEACLACVKTHLEPGGKFILDVFNPSLEILSREPGKRYFHAEYPDPDGLGDVVVTETHSYDAARQINNLLLFYKLPGREEELVEELRIRIYFPQELDALLKYNGFTLEHKFGYYDESPFQSASEKQLIVSSLRA